MTNIVISGAASGLGRELVVHYASAADDKTHIYAIDRAFPSADAAKTFPGSSKPSPWLQQHVHQYTVDVTSEEETQGFAALLDIDERPINLLYHCAGIRGFVQGMPIQKSDDTPKAETWEVMDKATMMHTFEVNTIGAFLFLRSCVPGLKRAATAKMAPKALVLGSRMGSVGDNSSGGAYAYRASKAALNTVVKSFSVDVAEVVWASLHPGRVETGLVAVKEEGAQPASEAAGQMIEVVKGLEKKDSGRFIDRFGQDISW